MPYLSSLHIDTDLINPFPFNIPAIRYAKNLDLSNQVTFIIGDNGTGKSTLIETIAFMMQLPHMDGSHYNVSTYAASLRLVEYLKLTYNIERPIGFFFRAEDFGNLINSINRYDETIARGWRYMEGEVPEQVLKEMRENANMQINHVRKNYGQTLESFSHGEAYLQIIQQKINSRGIYILDEPEAALSPSKQLSLIYYIKEHLSRFNSQFIIATHSPILMSYPEGTIYEINEDGMEKTPLHETDHYRITKSFLNNPESFLRHL